MAAWPLQLMFRFRLCKKERTALFEAPAKFRENREAEA